ncbi:TerD family protein, partial [Streptomyces clavuligerus]
MTAELARGQNHPLSATRLEIRVAGGHPLLACALGTDERGTAVGDSPARPGAPGLPGVQVPRQAAAVLRCAFDLDALPDTVHRVALVLALPEGPGAPGRFGATAGPHLALAGPGGTALAAFTVTGLDTETALIAVELYRRRGAWKVRAVGQGYAGGLARLLADEGHPRAREAAAEIQRAAAPTAPRAAPARLGTGSSAGAAAPGPAGGPAGPGTPADAVPPAASGSRDRGDTVDAARPPTGGPGDTAGAAAPRTGTPAPPPLAPSAAAPVPSAPIDYAH